VAANTSAVATSPGDTAASAAVAAAVTSVEPPRPSGAVKRSARAGTTSPAMFSTTPSTRRPT